MRLSNNFFNFVSLLKQRLRHYPNQVSMRCLHRKRTFFSSALICAYRLFCALREIWDNNASTRSRSCVTLSVDDTHNARDTEKVSYCYNCGLHKKTKYIRHHHQDWQNEYSTEYALCQQTRERQYKPLFCFYAQRNTGFL